MSRFILFFVSFLLVFIASVILNLPLSWVLDQKEVKEQIPKTLLLSQPQGDWWQGEVMVKLNTASEQIKLGKIAFTLNWSDLLFAKLGADIEWKLGTGKINAKIKTDGDFLSVNNLTGDMPVSELMKLSEKTMLVSDAEGELHLVDLSFELDLKDAWLTELSGKLAVTGFSAMGAEFGLLEAEPELKDKEIYTLITGGNPSKGWDLKAKTQLFKKHRYKLDLKVTATNPNNMPDWVALMLPMKNPKLANLRQSGKW